MNGKSRTLVILALLSVLLMVFAVPSASAHDFDKEGCTPGYWKNHPEDWQADAPDPYFFGNSLMDNLWARGGHENRLARHAAAAYLNAWHVDVHFPISMEQVENLFLAGRTNRLERLNESGCPL